MVGAAGAHVHMDAFEFIAGLTLLTELSLSVEFGPVNCPGLSTLQGLHILGLSGPPFMQQSVPGFCVYFAQLGIYQFGVFTC